VDMNQPVRIVTNGAEFREDRSRCRRLAGRGAPKTGY
jgi:hypothetical protein